MGLLGVSALILIAGSGIWGWQLYRNHLGTGRILAALDEQAGEGKVHFTAVSLEPVSTTDQERGFHFKAEGTLTTDLYAQANTDTLFSATYATTRPILEAVTEVLATPAGTRLVELANAGAPPSDPLALVLIEKTATAGTTVTAEGDLVATRTADGWKIEVGQGGFEPDLPAGAPRATLPADALVLSEPTTGKTLTDLVAARLAFAETLEATRVQLAEQIRQERETRRSALFALLQPGALFLGQANALSGDETIPGLVLEIVAVDESAQSVAALLRNNGDWTDTRPFEGQWQIDDDCNALALPLATRSSQALTDAGPLLATRGDWTIDLSLAPDGTLTGQSPDHRYSFTRVPADELARTRATLSALHEAALAATAPGSLYRGTATPTTGGEPSTVILRFTKQDSANGKLSAEIELAEQPGRARAFRGYFAANPHRTGGKPIQLASEARRRLTRSPSDAVTGIALDLAPALMPEGDNLTGEDGAFRYSLARVSAEELQKQTEQSRAATPALHVAGVALPPWPRAKGAYALIDGRWTPLPANGGRPVATKKRRNDDPAKVAELTYDGKDPVPTLGATAPAVIVYVGQIPPIPAELVEKHPEVLRGYPTMELSPTRKALFGGKRSADLFTVTPEIAGFQANRVAASLGTPEDDITLFTSSLPLQAGTYALLANGEAYELQVK